ncbi:bile acid:sodium symporter [Microbacterium aurantiacum]|uniref:Bile acid:sodium symporter n=1 Tax=Microbacterium aurantiacum TaxID=162393 RepID=A0ABT8FW62_9MICO|nr:bile acid:sodium symporter [Microbacterium aurantiacum]MDN4465548.1 bile acid:sodium symporter [Microbacterium aurantiacum]
MTPVAVTLERHQVVLCLAAIAGGAAVGILAPATAPVVAPAITPVIALLLFATFLGVPFRTLGAALRDTRFAGTVLAVNFLVVPLVVFVLSRAVAADEAALVGVLLVLLTPCVDYVIVFAGLAGGARDKLLAATPLLMVMQILLLPLYLLLMAGPAVVGAFDLRPFVEAFLLLIALPLGAAVLVQLGARRVRAVARIQDAATTAMVPLMMLTLAVVVASQIADVAGRAGALLAVVPVYLAFAAVMVPLGIVAGRVAGLAVPERRAVVFSGVTRNSLVVLPLALALPAGFALTPLVVVTQTLVELVAMVVLVAVVPRLVRHPSSTPPA